MDNSIRDVSFGKLLDDTSLFFLQAEKKLPQENFLTSSTVSQYLKTLRLVLIQSCVENDIPHTVFLQFSQFMSFLLKSTLYFHFCFHHPIQEPDSKLALMFGDLYLVQSGTCYTEIPNYLRLHKPLRELLYSISLSQRVQKKSSHIDKETFQKIVNLSYGKIIRFALMAPFIWNKQPIQHQRDLTEYAHSISLYLTLQIKPWLYPEDPPGKDDLEKLFTKIKNYLGEEKFHEYNFNGWKSDIQKITRKDEG